MKRFIPVISLLAALLLTACSPSAPGTAAAPDANYIYRPILDRCYDLVSHSIDPDAPEAGETGLWEIINWMSADEALDAIGYAITDISGDGTPELVIGEVTASSSEDSNCIYALYTCADGKPKLALEGWVRNRYCLMGDDRIYNQGSGGATHSAFGAYSLSDDGTTLNCDDFYFTLEKDDSSTDILCYQNDSGDYDKTVSREISMDEFRRMNQEYLDQTVSIALTPFSRYRSDSNADQ